MSVYQVVVKFSTIRFLISHVFSFYRSDYIFLPTTGNSFSAKILNLPLTPEHDKKLGRNIVQSVVNMKSRSCSIILQVEYILYSSLTWFQALNIPQKASCKSGSANIAIMSLLRYTGGVDEPTSSIMQSYQWQESM